MGPNHESGTVPDISNAAVVTQFKKIEKPVATDDEGCGTRCISHASSFPVS
jgi:hypothetical protein